MSVIEPEFMLGAGVLSDDYSLVVTADVLAVQRSAVELRAQPPANADPRDLLPGPLAMLVMVGIEIGVDTTLRTLLPTGFPCLRRPPVQV